MLLAEEPRWFSTWGEMALYSNYWSLLCIKGLCRPDTKTNLMKPGEKDCWSGGMETIKVFFQTLWKETTDFCHVLVDPFLFARYTAHSPSVCASSQIKFCKLSVLPQLVSPLWRVSLMSPWPIITNSTLFHCLFQCWPPKSDDYEVLNSTFSPFLMLTVLFSQIHIAKLWYHCSSVFCIHPALNLPVSSFLMLISVI